MRDRERGGADTERQRERETTTKKDKRRKKQTSRKADTEEDTQADRKKERQRKAESPDYLPLCVDGTHVGPQVETCRMHAASGFGHIGTNMGQVTLSGRLHLRKLASERHHCTPQGQKTAMLSAEVLVEGL